MKPIRHTSQFLLCTLLLLAPAPARADQAEINAIVARVAAGFGQTFDGQKLRRWQETYQNACLNEIPRLARLLQEDGADLPHDPYGQHRDLLRQTLSQMEDRHIQAMDAHVQLSQKWLGLPSTSSQAQALRGQMAAAEKNVKLYESIVATLRERLTYLDKCARLAEKSFADAARERAAQANTRVAQKPPAPRPPATRPAGPGDGTIAMPTGVPAKIDYDPKKGVSIGLIGEQAPVLTSGNVPTSPPASTTISSSHVSSAEVDAALRQAAEGCKARHNTAYRQLQERRRKTIEDAKAEIPRIEQCIRDNIREKEKWEQKLNEESASGRNPGQQGTIHEVLADRLQRLNAERNMWAERANKMEDQAAKNDAYRKWDQYNKEFERVDRELRKVKLISDNILASEQQKIDCEVRLQLLREKIARAEKVMGGDSLERTIAAHRAKRFAEIDRLLASRNLSALQRCVAQGYLELDDLMQELYR
jgi:hypothetical protein